MLLYLGEPPPVVDRGNAATGASAPDVVDTGQGQIGLTAVDTSHRSLQLMSIRLRREAGALILTVPRGYR